MQLTFNPPLGQQTIISIPSNGTAKVTFTAAFASRDAYERARNGGAYIEMWTNLPADDTAEEWRALRFEYPQESDLKPYEVKANPPGKVLSLAPPFALAPNRDKHSVSLDLVLRDTQHGSKYSFTYRVAYPSGDIEWLGSSGNNGDIAFQERDERIEWEDWWTVQDGGVVSGRGAEMQAERVASLTQDMEWTCWAFGESGWPTSSANGTAPPSKTVLLIPHPRTPARSLVVPQPVLLSVSSSAASLSVDEMGRVLAKNTRLINLQSLDAQDHVASALRGALPQKFQVLEPASDTHIAVASPSSQESPFPVSVSFIPLNAFAKGRYDVTISPADLRALLPSAQTPDVVLVDPSARAFCFVSVQLPETVTVQVGPAGGQLLLSPLHTLAPPDTQGWKLAMLAPTASAVVEMLTRTEVISASLPTPPPSPPYNVTSFKSSAASGIPSHSLPSYQSFHSLAESVQSTLETQPQEKPISPLKEQLVEPESQNQAHERLPKSEPETPSQEQEPEANAQTREEAISRSESPAAMSEVSIEQSKVEPAKDAVTTGQVNGEPNLTVTVRPDPNHFLQVFFAWFMRAVIARVWTFVDMSVHWFGAGPLVHDSAFHDENYIPLHHTRTSSSSSEPQDRMPGALEAVIVERSSHDLTAPSVRDKSFDETKDTKEPVSVSVHPASPPACVPASEPEQQPVAPLCTPDTASVAPPLLPPQPQGVAVTHIRPHFAAEVRSDAVSFLVHAPNVRAKPSELKVCINEKRVLDDSQGYTCAQLSGDVYVLGMRGPDGGSKIEITLD